ncbi:MAG: hypothetical protein WBE74_25715, partial [Terracidiphilus sp.]
HKVFVFESKPYRMQRSTSDISGIDPQIHNKTPKGIMAGLRNIFYQANGTTVPEMLSSYRAVKRKLSELRRNAGSRSLFEASALKDLVVAALVEREKILQRRGRAL